MAWRRLFGMISMTALALTMSCGGGDDEAINQMPVFNAGGASRPAPAVTTAEAAAVSATSEGYSGEPPAGIVRREFSEDARDPFMRQYPENLTPLEFDADVNLGQEDVVDLGPLANYPVESLRLVAIMTRTAEPKAMFMLPDGSGLGVLARIDDRVGPNGTGRIVDIQPNRVIVSYEGFGFGEGGEQARTLVLTLRDPSLDIEAVFEPY